LPLLCSLTRTVSETFSYGNEFALARLIRTKLFTEVDISNVERGSYMSISVLGIDIAKKKFDVALLVDGKTKHKACKNSVEDLKL
jgi:hypothetical protein